MSPMRCSASSLFSNSACFSRCLSRRFFTCCVLVASVLAWGGGCGGSSEETAPPASPPAMAVKDIQFGAGVVAVQNRIGQLQNILRDGQLSIYRFDPAEQGDGGRQRTPVRFYDFHFYREELSQVQVLYDLDELRSEIGREKFFLAIEERYQAKEDFNASEGRRWINMDKGVEVRWLEDIEHDSGRLVVTWLEHRKALEAAREALRGRRRNEEERDSNGGGVDIGI